MGRGTWPAARVSCYERLKDVLPCKIFQMKFINFMNNKMKRKSGANM